MGDEGSTGQKWPVTLVYVTVFAGLAFLEVYGVSRVRVNRKARRARPSPPWPEPWPAGSDRSVDRTVRPPDS